MSWDVIIAKTSDTNFTKPSDNASFVSMGRPGDIQSKLNRAVPSIKWASLAEGHAYVGALSLEFSLIIRKHPVPTMAVQKGITESEDVDSISVSARGSGDPVSIVVAIAKTNQWSVADAQDGAWINLNSYNQKTWKKFTEYRDQVAGKSGDENFSHTGSIGLNLMISVAVFIAVILGIRSLSK